MIVERFFQPCEGFENQVELPKRSTKRAAGYDFYAAEDITIESYWWKLFKWVFNNETVAIPTIVPTHIKAKMQDDEVLLLFNRSSNPFRGLVLANSVGVVDSDYYGNPKNDGDIGFPFYNFFPVPITIYKGQKIGQGVFMKYLLANGDNVEDTAERSGGFGSTGA